MMGYHIFIYDVTKSTIFGQSFLTPSPYHTKPTHTKTAKNIMK